MFTSTRVSRNCFTNQLAASQNQKQRCLYYVQLTEKTESTNQLFRYSFRRLRQLIVFTNSQRIRKFKIFSRMLSTDQSKPSILNSSRWTRTPMIRFFVLQISILFSQKLLLFSFSIRYFYPAKNRSSKPSLPLCFDLSNLRKNTSMSLKKKNMKKTMRRRIIINKRI